MSAPSLLDCRKRVTTLPLTQQANQMVFVLGPNAIPNGPYRKVEP